MSSKSKEFPAGLQRATLVFPIRKTNGQITEVCLAMKKRGFGAGKWNGSGGKLEEEKDKTIQDTAIRETQEELGIQIYDLTEVGRLTFRFPSNPEWEQAVYVYLSESWEGEPTESEEMKPRWFKVGEVPYDEMWSTDKFWLTEVLRGKKAQGEFVLGENDETIDKTIDIA